MQEALNKTLHVSIFSLGVDTTRRLLATAFSEQVNAHSSGIRLLSTSLSDQLGSAKPTEPSQKQ